MHVQTLPGPALPPPGHSSDGDQTRSAPGFRQTGQTARHRARGARQLQDGWPLASIARKLPHQIRWTASPRSWYLCGSVECKVRPLFAPLARSTRPHPYAYDGENLDEQLQA